jgi:hypothetical protein
MVVDVCCGGVGCEMCDEEEETQGHKAIAGFGKLLVVSIVCARKARFPQSSLIIYSPPVRGC